jgi:hypothetical protein
MPYTSYLFSISFTSITLRCQTQGTASIEESSTTTSQQYDDYSNNDDHHTPSSSSVSIRTSPATPTKRTISGAKGNVQLARNGAFHVFINFRLATTVLGDQRLTDIGPGFGAKFGSAGNFKGHCFSVAFFDRIREIGFKGRNKTGTFGSIGGDTDARHIKHGCTRHDERIRQCMDIPRSV